MTDRFSVGGQGGMGVGGLGGIEIEGLVGTGLGDQGGYLGPTYEPLYLDMLVDTAVAAPTDGYVLTFDAVIGKWIASAPTGGSGIEMETENVSFDIDFSSSSVEDIEITLGSEVRLMLLGKMYIDVDPGVPFDQWATYTFFNKSSKRGEDAFYKSVARMSYTELEVATTGSDADIIPDDHTVFGEQNLVYFIDGGNSEFVRLMTIADTMVAEDTVAAHPIDTGISRASEFSGFSLFNDESATAIYFRVEFASIQTVSLKLDLVLVK